MLTLVLREHILRNTGIDSDGVEQRKMRLESEAGPTWRGFQMPVRNSDFKNNGEPLDAFKPKQVNDTIRSMRTCICVSLCVCLCLISLFPDYKCSC